MEDRISVDPKVCSGKPCIRGTRIMVKNILGLIAGGYPVERIIETYPELTRDDVAAALDYASQVIDEEKVIGSITESIIINQLMQNNNGAQMAVKECMTDPFPILDFGTKCKDLQKHINRKNPAILTIDHKQNMHIITQYDLLQILSA